MYCTFLGKNKQIFKFFFFQFQMESPAVKDLPKLDTQISQEIAKDHNLKKVEVCFQNFDFDIFKKLN